MAVATVAPMTVGPDGTLPLPWLAQPLADALAQQRGHALMLHGAPGVGTLPFGLVLAQAWLCEGQGETAPRPCGRCGSCHLLQVHGHPDLFVLLPELLRRTLNWPLIDDKPEADDKKKPSRQIRIDEVRAAIDWVNKTSSRGRGKLLLIHPAEALNLQAASALLKTLEEPPAGTRVLLSTADPANLLPTVRSRCQRLPLPAPAREEAVRWLVAQGVAGAEVLLAAASGRPLDAQALASDGVDAAAWTALPRTLAQGQGGQGAPLAGWPVPRALDALQKVCHDALAQAAGGSGRYFPAGSVPRGVSVAALVDWQRSLARVARHDEHPWHEGLLLETLASEARRALTITA
jgi:DNA polymerase-3 subunit delta'